jgi:3-hydroxypropanoate dehydrogenase
MRRLHHLATFYQGGAMTSTSNAQLGSRRRLSNLDDGALDLIFRAARTHKAWHPRPVSDGDLRRLYEVFKFGPTSVNCNPARFLFVRSPEAKAKLISTLYPSNVPKVTAAPVTAIIGYDTRFFEHLPRLFPATDAERFRNDAAFAERYAFRNGTLQGAYLIITARALGFDVGPMSGFDDAKVDAAFFSGTSVRSNFLCNIGYGDETALSPRPLRFEFDEVCTIL